ncbi:hypothetical protein [Streptomyces niveus]|uniref:Uncharacterized protein n=1 Tax=Streptomyces niveus TaxID=193462 RepID=A0ABZ2AC00_STRNV|nr:hypothetical protein [Streptomyces niveus]
MTAVEDDQDELGQLVRGQAEKRAAAGDVAFVGELGVRPARRPDGRRIAVLAATDTDQGVF